jgi:hypothetical protein
MITLPQQTAFTRHDARNFDSSSLPAHSINKQCTTTIFTQAVKFHWTQLRSYRQLSPLTVWRAPGSRCGRRETCPRRPPRTPPGRWAWAPVMARWRAQRCIKDERSRMRAHEQTVCACAINVVESPITLCQPRLLAHKRHSTTSTELFKIGHTAGAL